MLRHFKTEGQVEPVNSSLVWWIKPTSLGRRKGKKTKQNEKKWGNISTIQREKNRQKKNYLWRHTDLPVQNNYTVAAVKTQALPNLFKEGNDDTT